MRKILFLLIIIFPLKAIGQKVSSLSFNEIMISNIDEYLIDYDFPDSWIELYNPTDTDIHLQGCTLVNLTKDEEESYTFSTDQIVPRNGYLVVYCDKEDTGLHTSFHLDAKGGTLYLLSDDKTISITQEYPKMIAPQVGYGRTSDNPDIWNWEKEATPGSPNRGLFTDIILPDPVFSLPGQVMSNSAEITVSMPDEQLPKGTRLYVTFDGKEPSLDSPSYESSFSTTINKSTVIRAKLISPNALSDRSITNSYIFHPSKTQLPVFSIVTDDSFFYGDTLGIFSSNVIEGNTPNFAKKWRRPINIEFLNHATDSSGFNQVAETSIGGMFSRYFEKKSLKVYANKRFGKKRFKGNFWEDKPEINKIKSFSIRNGGSVPYSSQIDDAFIQKLFGTHISNLDWMAYTPVILYINGTYKGSYELRERSNKDFIWQNYNGLEDIIITKLAQDLYEEIDISPTNTSLIDSLSLNFDSLLQKEALQKIAPLFTKLFNSDLSFAEVDAMMDIDEIVNHLCVHIFGANPDYIFNNLDYWRPIAEGGKWRAITIDLDCFSHAVEGVSDPVNFNEFVFFADSGKKGSQEYNVTHYYAAKSYFSPCFRNLILVPEVRDIIVEHLSTYLGDFLKPKVSIALLTDMVNEIRDEIYPTLELYNMGTPETYDLSINELVAFLSQRPMKVYEHMASFYNLGKVIPMTISRNEDLVSMNDIQLTEGDFEGAYFSNHLLKLNSGANNVGWKLSVYTDGVKKSHDYVYKQQNLELLLSDYADCDSVAFSTYQIHEDSSISSIQADESSSEAVYNLWGKRIDNPKEGLIIKRQHGGQYKKQFIKKD